MDHGFTVLNWGDLTCDVHLPIKNWEQAKDAKELCSQQLENKYDIIPSGFKSERKLTLKSLRPVARYFAVRHSGYSVITDDYDADDADCDMDDADISLFLQRDTNLELTPIEYVVQLKAQHRGERMMYAVKSGTRTPFEDSYWCNSATQALSDFKSRENIISSHTDSALFFFGFQSRTVQEHLFKLRSSPDSSAKEEVPPKKKRTALKRKTFKQVVALIIARNKKKSPDSRPSSSSSSSSATISSNSSSISSMPSSTLASTNAPMRFGYRAAQAAVENMLHEVGDVLIDGRQPEERAQQVMRQFMNHPDVKKLLRSLAMQHWHCDEKQLLVIDHILSNLRLAISEHKNLRNRESLRLYQTLLGICCPPSSLRLQRAAADLLGLASRRGLIAAGMRVAAQQVQKEGGGDCHLDVDITHCSCTMFMPVIERKRRAAWLAGAELRDAARRYWTVHTRPSVCKKNVVTLQDGTEHPVHWLETKVDELYREFLAAGDHFYSTQLLVRHVPADTTSLHVRKVFSAWRPSRVNPRSEGKYFYVVFSSEKDCQAALEGAQHSTFELQATVTQRPMMGSTAFSNERPSFIKDVTATSCVCHRCRGMVLMFKGMLHFRHWEHACARASELLEDVRKPISSFFS